MIVRLRDRVSKSIKTICWYSPVSSFPLAYGTVTHHTSADTLDHAVPADLMQASAVIATVVYQAANRPQQLPRREILRPAK